MTESVLRLRGRSAVFDSMGAGWAMSPDLWAYQK
ncbi:unnamed protein product [Brassica oleracea var. botrytis]